MSDNTQRVLEYLKAHNGENLTAADIAEALGVDVKVVNGAVTAGLIGTREPRKNLAERVEGTIQVEKEVDGEIQTVEKAVKFIRITEAGLTFDPTADAQ